MEFFVQENSILRKIWGKGDTIIFIFAGAAAEFALNKAVDWLYFTGRLPADPIGRLFSTVTYARKIIFSDYNTALEHIDKITAIHNTVEKNRGAQIPDWAYRDVLFMLIDYSIRSYEILEKKLSEAEKNEVFDVFHRVGIRMGLTGLPRTYFEWISMREDHLNNNLECSHFTLDLFHQYKKHLGNFRYALLKQGQLLVVPEKVKNLLALGNIYWMKPILKIYKLSRLLKLNNYVRNAILPVKYMNQIKDLDV